MITQKKDNGAQVLVPPVGGIVNVKKKTDWARTFLQAVNTPLGTVLTILFSLALGVGFGIPLSQSYSPIARVPASNPAVAVSKAPISVPPPPTLAATVAASTAPISVPPPSTLAATVAASTAPISVPPPPTPSATVAASTVPSSLPPPPAIPTTAAAASTAPISVPPRPNSTAAVLDREEVAAQLARGRASLSNGDVAGARLILRWAAEHDDPQAAVALGETYDPTVLKRLGIIKFADLAQAREWYRRAADLGSAAATSRLDQLSK